LKNDLKKTEQYSLNLLRIVEEQKQNLNKMNKKVNSSIEYEIQHLKRILLDKDQEIHFLKNYSTSLKFNNETKVQETIKAGTKDQKSKS
jgi:hypothetical protein